jgi:hypothetical protein
MTMVMNYYTLSDFNQMFKMYGAKPLDSFTEEVVSYLEKNIIIPAPEPENSTKKIDRLPNENRSNRGRRNGDSQRAGNNHESQEDWNKMRQFKNTKVENKEGIEKNFSDIRALMNKLSSKNYETQKGEIFAQLSLIMLSILLNASLFSLESKLITAFSLTLFLTLMFSSYIIIPLAMTRNSFRMRLATI